MATTENPAYSAQYDMAIMGTYGLAQTPTTTPAPAGWTPAPWTSAPWTSPAPSVNVGFDPTLSYNSDPTLTGTTGAPLVQVEGAENFGERPAYYFNFLVVCV